MDSRHTEEQRLDQPVTPDAEDDDFFREINDRILELGHRFGLQEDELELVCESDDSGCTARVVIPADDFERLRAEDGHHLVVEGHERSGRVVFRGDGYVVVEA
jgi:hypothetical protein